MEGPATANKQWLNREPGTTYFQEDAYSKRIHSVANLQGLVSIRGWMALGFNVLCSTSVLA